jgi:hypothetical protein
MATMTGSQLDAEYEGMADRRELYAKYGITAEAAQLFETELGTLLLGLRGLDEGWHIIPDGQAARRVLDEIDRSTLGRLLQSLKRYIKIDSDLEEAFASALEARNRLMHGFFERHNFKIQTEVGRQIMNADLDRLHSELLAAWQAAGDLTTILEAAVRVHKRVLIPNEDSP